MYDIILFDLDDTLLDFSASENKSLVTLHKEYYSSMPYEQFDLTFKEINTALWKRVGAKENGLKPGEVRLLRFEQLNQRVNCFIPATTIAAFYEKCLGENADWYPKVKHAVEFLHGKGHILGVVTNGLMSVQDKKYEQHSLGDWFDCYIVSDRVGVAKPHREIFDHAFEAIAQKRGVDISVLKEKRMLMVGDTLASDGKSAENLGIDFCFINQKNTNSAESGLVIKHEMQSVAKLPAALGYDMEYVSFLAARGNLVSFRENAIWSQEPGTTQTSSSGLVARM